MSVGKDKGKDWGRKAVGMPAAASHPKDRTKAKAQPRLKGYKKKSKR